MSVPNNFPELAVPQADVVDAAEINRCLVSAAALVEGFAERSAITALDAMLAAAGSGEASNLDRARQLAVGVLQQTVTLQDEVGRFLSMTKG